MVRYLTKIHIVNVLVLNFQQKLSWFSINYGYNKPLVYNLFNNLNFGLFSNILIFHNLAKHHICLVDVFTHLPWLSTNWKKVSASHSQPSGWPGGCYAQPTWLPVYSWRVRSSSIFSRPWLVRSSMDSCEMSCS